MTTTIAATLALSTLGFGMISGRIEKSILTPPMAFVAFGLGISPFMLQVLDIDHDGGIIDIIATTTLVLTLKVCAPKLMLTVETAQTQE